MRKYKIPAALLLNGKPVSAKSRKRVPHPLDDVKHPASISSDSILQAYEYGENGCENAGRYEKGSLEYSAWKSGMERGGYHV